MRGPPPPIEPFEAILLFLMFMILFTLIMMLILAALSGCSMGDIDCLDAYPRGRVFGLAAVVTMLIRALLIRALL